MTDEIKQEEETQEQEAPTQAPAPEQRLDMDEILGALQTANVEVAKWQGVSNTLTKCAILFNSIIKAQQEQQQAQEAPAGGVSETE